MHIEGTMSSRSNLIDFIHRPKYICAMKRRQAFKFELKLLISHVRKLYCIAGSCRFVFNKALALQKERYERGEKKLTYAALCKELTAWRNDIVWLENSPSQALQQSLKDLERAYQNFFAKRADFPRFKRRGVKDAFRFPQGVKLDQANSRIFLPKLGWVRYRNSRFVEGDICNVTISRACDKWYVSIQTEREVPEPIHPANASVGIDVGITHFATLSNGTVYAPVNSFKSHQKRLTAYQRRASKKKKFSQNWKKAIRKVSHLHQKISHMRKNYLHQLSNTISKNHAMICLEDLQIKNMSKSAAGDSVMPGKNVKAKSGLNKSILDQGWGEFRRQLEYKQCWRGGMVVIVPAHYTSQTCPECDHVDTRNRVTQSQFICMKCNYKNDADIVGAINILRAGHARLACGEMVQLGHSMNQEPTEVVHAIGA
jgi:putative transposase